MTASPDGLILDFDGIFYRYTAGFNMACSQAAARAARKHGITGSHESLVNAFCEARNPHAFARQWQQEFGLNVDAYHHDYHDEVPVEDVIDRRQEACAAFCKLAELRIPMVILTQASEPWVRRVGAHIDASPVLKHAKIVAFEHVGYKSKASGPEPVEIALTHLGLPARRVKMVEDSSLNLLHASMLGISTGYVHYGRELVPCPAHVHVQAPCVPSLLSKMGFAVANS